MPMFEAETAAICRYSVVADDVEHSIDLFMDLTKEDFPDADRYEVAGIKEIKE